MENNFNIERDGFQLNNNSFERNDYSFNNNNNFNSNSFNEPNRPEYTSLDGRVWESKSDEFAANKEYYQKMLEESRKSN